MKRFVVVLFVLLTFGCTAHVVSPKPAAHSKALSKPATQDQRNELNRLLDNESIDRAEVEEILSKYSSPPETCKDVEIDYDLNRDDVREKVFWTDYFSRSERNLYYKAGPRGKGRVKKKLCWFKFDSDVSTYEARNRIEASGEFTAVDLWELYAFGQSDPDLQLEFRIVAIGTVRGASRWRGSGAYSVPNLCGGEHNNFCLNLNLHGPVSKWSSESTRFLAIRNRK